MTDVADRRYHHGNLREALLARAGEIVRERGVADLSLREIARDAAPRRHFPDRQALLDALALHGFARLEADLAAAVAGSRRAGFRTRLTRTAGAYARFATEEAALLELMFAGKHRTPDGPLHDAAYAAFAPVVALLAEGQEAGEIVPGPIEDSGTALLATLQGIAAMVTGGLLAADELERTVPRVVGTLLDGLRPR